MRRTRQNMTFSQENSAGNKPARAHFQVYRKEKESSLLRGWQALMAIGTVGILAETISRRESGSIRVVNFPVSANFMRVTFVLALNLLVDWLAQYSEFKKEHHPHEQNDGYRRTGIRAGPCFSRANGTRGAQRLHPALCR